MTQAGKYIYHQSKNIIENIEDMQEKAKFIASSNNYSIKIGYLKNYTGKELQKAIVEFNRRFPEVEIELISGTHDELGNKVFNNEIDLKFTDQRKAFSDEFVNFPVCTQYFSIKVPIYNELANDAKVTLEDTKDMTIIIIATKEQRESEANFYHNILGFKGNFIFAENLEEANLLVACNKGVLPIESMVKQAESDGTIKIIPLYYEQNQMSRKYYAFWKKENQNPVIRDFADILKEMFNHENEINNEIINLNTQITTKFISLLTSMISSLIVLYTINIFIVATILFTGIIVSRLIYFFKKYLPAIKKLKNIAM